jgi:hypothetical protein
MATEATPKIKRGSLLNASVQESIIRYAKECYRAYITREQDRARFQLIDRQYARELDLTDDTIKQKMWENAGDPTKFRNIVAPVILPQVENAVVYQTSVFLAGTPIFGVVAPNESVDAGMQMEAVIAENQERGGWISHFIMAFRDGFKYNRMGVEVTWDTIQTYSIVPSATDPKGRNAKSVNWEGNCITRLDMYNTFYDLRVDIAEIPEKGEFAGYTEMISRIELRKYLNSIEEADGALPNNQKALESTSIEPSSLTHYIPEISFIHTSPKKHTNASPNWMAFVNMDVEENTRKNFKDSYERMVIYARCCPADFGLISAAASNVPQIYKIVIINRSVLVLFQRQTNKHDLIPLIFAQPLEDGLNDQTKSLAENVQPMQSVTSALINGVIQARKRAIADRAVYNPRLVDEKDVNSDNPTQKIKLRPAAQALSDVRQAYYPIPYNDTVSAASLQDIGVVDSYSNKITGQNPARGGQFVKGNKTKEEFSTVMQNANGRDQLTSLHLEARFFSKIKQIIKMNILQYQGSTELLDRTNKKFIKVSPEQLLEANTEFKISDGLVPSDKLMDSESFTIALQTIQSVPALQSGYDLIGMFSYFLKSRGAHIQDFELSDKERRYNDAVNQWKELAMAAIQKGAQFNTPQPKPEDYGIKPQQPNNPQAPFNPATQGA